MNMLLVAARMATCAGLLVGLTAPALAQQVFPPTGTDVLATPMKTMLDPEFNYNRRQFTWVDVATGDIWVGGYDYTTGNFLPADGRGTLIEAAVSVGGAYPGLGFTVNGPEWALGTGTDYVVYTRNNVPGDPTPANAYIGTAYQGPDGTWVRRTLLPIQRNGPYGSKNRAALAKISYQDANGTHYVRAVGDAGTERPLPGLTQTGLRPAARFASTGNIVAYQLTINGIAQSVSYDLDTATLRQLTFDAGAKDQSWLFSAPEVGGALALAAVVGKTSIVMYTPVIDTGGNVLSYQRFAEVRAPQGGTWYSLEPFSYQGQSYGLAQLTPAGSSYPTSIWMFSFDPAAPLLRQLTPNTVATEARGDAEIVPLATGPIIVYSKFDTTKCPPGSASSWLCMPGLMGLFRASTGLPAPR